MKTSTIKLKALIALLLWSGFVCSQEIQSPQDHLTSEFHQNRRNALREKLPENSVAVFFSSPVRNRSNDVDFLYHQDPNLYYFTGYKEPHAVLLIFKEAQNGENGASFKELFFVQPKNARAEMWTGRRLGTTGVQSTLGIQMALDNTEFAKLGIDFSTFDKVIFSDFRNDVRNTWSKSDLFDLIVQFKEKVGYPGAENTSLNQEKAPKNIDTKSLRAIMADLRGVKLEEELALIRKAVMISAIGQVEVMKAMKPGISEAEIQGIHEFVFKKYGSEYEGYPSIVGAGHNGCILHYQDNHKPEVNSKEMVLMDLGAEYRGYTADVTRTIPVKGVFSKEQKQIYDLVYKAQEEAIQACKPGASFEELSTIARTIINEGLADLGVIKSPDQRHMYYPHGLCHHIGLDVHDAGNYELLSENMVITVEPGIYIPENADCDKKWWGIAVRIEDDILITADGHENLSAFAPRKSEEIEKMMALPSPLDQFNLPSLDK